MFYNVCLFHNHTFKKLKPIIKIIISSYSAYHLKLYHCSLFSRQVTEVKVADCYEDPEEALQRKQQQSSTKHSTSDTPGITAGVSACVATASAVTASGGSSSCSSNSDPNIDSSDSSPSNPSAQPNEMEHKDTNTKNKGAKSSKPIDITVSSSPVCSVYSTPPKSSNDISGSPVSKSRTTGPINNHNISSSPAPGGKGIVCSKGTSVYGVQKSSTASTVCPLESKPKSFPSDSVKCKLDSDRKNSLDKCVSFASTKPHNMKKRNSLDSVTKF